jgi:hypothetical protein
MRVQRTGSSPSALRSPLTRYPLGGSKAIVAAAVFFMLPAVMRSYQLSQPSPELVGLKKVAVVLTFTIDLDRDAVEAAIQERLAAAGIIVVHDSAAPTLRISVDTSLFETPLCPGMVSLQVRIALEEAVVVKRNRAVTRAAVWMNEHVAAIVSKGDVATLAAEDVEYLVGLFAQIVTENNPTRSPRTKP